MLRTRTISTIGVALVLAAPSTAGAQQDLRSPDARDAGVVVTAPQDMRSPDARDAAAVGTVPQDMRSPDARDAAQPNPPRPVSRTASPATGVANGFGWADAGIGAAGMLGIVLAVGGIALLTTHQRRRDHVSVAGR